MTGDINCLQVVCPKCGAFIGEYNSDADYVTLTVGNYVIDLSHGRCKICDTPFYWDKTEKKLDILIEHVMKLRKYVL